MRNFLFVISLLVIVTIGCSPKASKIPTAELNICNELLSACKGNPSGDYCLFGYKWGVNQQFSSKGVEAPGPQISGDTITFSFGTEIKYLRSHQSNSLETVNFDDKGECAREAVYSALEEWEEFGNFIFKEEKDNSNSNIKLYSVKNGNLSIGNVNYQDNLCSEIAGHVLLNANKIDDCHNFFILCLHEIGHALGLGHVNSPNIMNQEIGKYQFKGLQSGDIRGIVAIYGEKKLK